MISRLWNLEFISLYKQGLFLRWRRTSRRTHQTSKRGWDGDWDQHRHSYREEEENKTYELDGSE